MKDQDPNTNVMRAGVWYTISTIMVKAISVISTPILTRMMTKADYGTATTFTSWNNLLLIICSLNLGYSIGRAKQDFPGQFDRYIGSMQVLGSIVTGMLAVLSLVFIRPVSEFLVLDEICIMILLIYIWGGMVVNMQQNWYRYNYKYKQNIAITVYTAISTIVLSIILVALRNDNKYIGRCLGLALPTFGLGILFALFGFKEKRLCCDKAYWQYGLRLSIPLIIHTISLYILGQSDRIFITKICGQEATGMYSLAYQYASLILLITNAVNEAWNPWFHDTYYEGKYDEIKKNVKPLIIFGCMLCIGAVALAPEAVLILGGKQYSESVHVILPSALGILMQYLYTNYVIIEVHLKRVKYISIGTMIAAVCNIVLNAIFIPYFGYVAAAYTTLACYGLLFVVHFVISRYVLKIHLYEDRFVFGCLLAASAICVGFSMLHEFNILRYSVLTILCCIYLIKNKEYILLVINQFIKK